MTTEELIEVTKLFLERVEWDFETVEEDGYPVIVVAPFHDDAPPALIGPGEIEVDDGPPIPYMWVTTAVFVEVDTKACDFEKLDRADAELDLFQLNVDAGSLWLGYSAVGWPGAEELQVALELMFVTASELREDEDLLAASGGSLPQDG